MPAARTPELEPGKVYRTRDLAVWGRNPTRLARRLERDGALSRLAQGLFVHPKQSRFGPVPPDDEEVLRAFLDGAPFVLTGPEFWNALGLGATALFTARMVYNTKRSGEFELGGRRFILRRVRFPDRPTPEWYVIDLIEHHEMAGVSLEVVEAALVQAVKARRFHPRGLRMAAGEFGTAATRALVERTLAAEGAA